ncbi:MAG: PLP-dependent aminotransferase family protein [Flavobacteriaceae bacterium]|jgi:GntR family transcriptional regulator/MocR family aminotransferase|nr:PLP-dependent aminotransferase family protein [Flavobacteriaceae bacterium]
MLRPWNVEMQVDHNSAQPLYLQIVDAIIADIQSGRLQKGMALPGSRKLAQDLKVNRNTVVEALNVLLADGYLISKERKGTFVSEEIETLIDQLAPIESTVITEEESYRIRFEDGHPDSKIAPVKELARAYRQIFNRKAKWQRMGYVSEYGDLSFRKAMIQMLNQQRGMNAMLDEICITRGSQMAMYLIAQCLLNKGDSVLVEIPGYRAAWSAFEHAGATLLPVSVDSEGLSIDDVKIHLKNHSNIKAIYTTPHHQYPTTVSLSLKRRKELVDLSNQHGFVIIEDDYDNEFHYTQQPLLPISSLPYLKQYIYIGTMSKVVAPALRIGFVVTNNKILLKSIGDLRKIIDVQGDVIMEQAILQLIEDGTIKRHLKRATSFYKKKRNTAIDLVEKHLGDWVTYTIPLGGMALWIVPKQEVSWTIFERFLQSEKVGIMSPQRYVLTGEGNGFRLSFGALSEEVLEEGMLILAKAFQIATIKK